MRQPAAHYCIATRKGVRFSFGRQPQTSIIFWKQTKKLTLPEIIHFTEDLFVFDVTAVVLTQRRPADRTLQTPHVPDQVIHLEKVSVQDLQTAARAHVLPGGQHRGGGGGRRADRWSRGGTRGGARVRSVGFPILHVRSVGFPVRVRHDVFGFHTARGTRCTLLHSWRNDLQDKV